MQEALNSIKVMTANMGSTEALPPLIKAVNILKAEKKLYRKKIFFLTDGGVGAKGNEILKFGEKYGKEI